jgi:acyl dehydratase
MDRGRTINELVLNEEITIDFTVEDRNVREFASATGDYNPIHVDDEYARKSPFGKRVAHGILLSGIVSGLLGTKLPGLGTVAREMYSKFIRPVFIGDNLKINAKVTEKKEKLNICKIEFTVINQDNVTVGKGYAVVIPPSEIK